MCVGPGKADAGGAAADARCFQHRNGRAGLSQPIRDRGAHYASADYDRHVSDLVFVNAPGTGFSRIAAKDEEKAFYGVDAMD